jgi:hypothetical protein
MDWRTYSFGTWHANRTFGMILAVLGVLLVTIGVLIIVLPFLLQFLVGGLFIMIGMGLLGAGLRRRQQPRPPGPYSEPDIVEDEWR